MTIDIFALSGTQMTPVALGSLTPVGGRGASGIALETLKHEGDYAILAVQDAGVAVHPLRGSGARTARTITAGQFVQIDDLTLLVLPKAKAGASNGDLTSIQNALAQMSESGNSERPLAQLLKEIMKAAKHEKGLIITKNISGEFEILIGDGLDADRSWISEQLVTDCLQTKKPTFVNNIIGSTYNSSESLMSTGFLSVFCWPLTVQGVALGVLLTGSRRPHAGLSSDESARISTFVHLAAMIANFRLRELSLKREIERLRSRDEDSPFQTQNKALKQTCDLARQVADSDLSILIQGETGVGKEVMARWLHERSSRAKGPFVAVNCGAIPGELLESLLFGHKKGSFTHAISDQMGKVQQAHSGTLFLDEIGDLPAHLQPKLLRVLNDKSVEPLGSNRPVQVDVRIVAATHKPLKELALQKQFRDDLYYRLAEMTLWIPPLRERPSDILLIAAQWLKDLDASKVFSEDARAWLMAQSWKGNVRELKSVIKRAVVLSGGEEIQRKHFLLGQESETARVPEGLDWLGGENLEQAKQNFVQSKIEHALELTAGNRTKAAQLLGVTARTLFRYLEDDTKETSQ